MTAGYSAGTNFGFNATAYTPSTEYYQSAQPSSAAPGGCEQGDDPTKYGITRGYFADPTELYPTSADVDFSASEGYHIANSSASYSAYQSPLEYHSGPIPSAEHFHDDGDVIILSSLEEDQASRHRRRSSSQASGKGKGRAGSGRNTPKRTSSKGRR